MPSKRSTAVLSTAYCHLPTAYFLLVRTDRVHDAAPDFEVHRLDDFDGLEAVVLGHEPDAAVADAQALDAQLVVDARDHDVAVLCVNLTVNDEDRAGVNPGARH